MVIERTPWQHQLDVIPKAVRSRFYGLFWQMGTGKTYTSIQILRHWFTEEKRVMRTLVLGPPIVVENWYREICAYSKFGVQTTKLQGTGKERIKAFERKRELGHVFITNFHSLLNKDLFEKILAWGPEVLVFDEIHRLKDPKSKTSKAALKLSKLAIRKLGLTGTPVLNSPADVFQQMLLLDNGKTLGKNFVVFRNNFFVDRNAGMPKQRYFPKWEPIASKQALLSKMLAPLTSVVKKEECLSLPPLVRQIRYVSLSPEQKKIYESLKKDFVAFLGEKECTTDLAITRALRMQQVVSGYMPVTNSLETETYEFKDNPRIKALEEILEDIGDAKVIIWAVYHANYKAIRDLCERRQIRFVEVHGQVSALEKQKAIDLFTLDPGIKVFLGHPLSGGIGVNLVVAPYSIFYSRNFSLEQSLQAEARNHRGGSEIHQSITRIDLVAKGTIEELVVEALHSKQSVLDSILKGISDDNKSRRIRASSAKIVSAPAGN